MGVRAREVTLRFLASPTDVASTGSDAVAGARGLEWIDKAAYACAVGWSGGYCVTAYVGNVNFTRPIHSGDMVEAHARVVHTGRSSMHIEPLDRTGCQRWR
jgi:acyl-CoA hydrolase